MPEKVIVPPIKSQGIKTKLVPWIRTNVAPLRPQRWVEPFMGTGVVAFNIRPAKALLCDCNPHLIRFYQALQSKEIDADTVRIFLEREGQLLATSRGEHFYLVRERFNAQGHPLDFLFLSRSCFNGMMRFNQSGGFNVPFCKKPGRFAPALVTKICNQVRRVGEVIAAGDYTFVHQDFQQCLSQVDEGDLVYADPPYLHRHVGYYDSWSEAQDLHLQRLLHQSGVKFLVSTWLGNRHRFNEWLFETWPGCQIARKSHFYHVGGHTQHRNAMQEALLANFPLPEGMAKEIAHIEWKPSN